MLLSKLPQLLRILNYPWRSPSISTKRKIAIPIICKTKDASSIQHVSQKMQIATNLSLNLKVSLLRLKFLIEFSPALELPVVMASIDLKSIIRKTGKILFYVY